ncbi:MAG: DinB family protein [Pyrinomonadaceae bacterium]
MNRPEKTEYDAYYEKYVSLVEETDIVSALENQLNDLQNLLAAVSEEKSFYGYAEGKWTIKEVIGHLIDGERIFAYRALRIGRADATPLEGFEQDGYIENANFNEQPLAELTEELLLLRRANNLFFKNLSDAAWLRIGTASDAPVSVRALAYIMVGHIRHHTNILRERYLSSNLMEH